MAKIYYIPQATSLYKGISIAATLMGLMLIFIGFMAYRQDGEGMSLIEYIQDNSFFLIFELVVTVFFFLGAWYLNKSSIGTYRVDEDGVQYKDKKNHFVIKWNEIILIELDGYGTVVFHGLSKRFVFSTLAVELSSEDSNNKKGSIFQSLSSFYSFIGLGKRIELSPYAIEVIEFITQKIDSFQIEKKININCGIKRNKNVKATHEIF